ncbi:MAG TPA: hypothetical protein VM345_00860 [Acidimicrobiales bacterium]|jgi:hypothetical protein|nr:hypothetical protein [Acidimicrobiales bacterium]
MRDLERLAGEPVGDAVAHSEGGSDVVEVPAPVAVDRAVGAVIIDDGFVRVVMRTSVHLRRYLPYYGAAALWAFLMLAMAPRGGDDPAQFAGANYRGSGVPAGRVSQTTGAAPTIPPSFDAMAATPGPSAFSYFDDEAFAGDASAPSEAPAFATADSLPSEFPAAPYESHATAEPLRIVKAGYSSRTGGTPLEQEPPEGGLPVVNAGSETIKRSFIALAGHETVLRLRLVDHPSNVGAAQAIVRACPISVDEWQAARGATFANEPRWSSDPCARGERLDDGVWTFDLSQFGDPETWRGFTLTPGPGAPFNLTFSTTTISTTST